MADNRDKVINLIGKAKYDEEIELLKQVEKDDEKKGGFQSIAGAVDKRDDNLRDIILSSGFES